MAPPLRVAFLTLYPLETASTRQRVYKNVRLFPAGIEAEVYPGIASATMRRQEALGDGRVARALTLVEELGRKLAHLWRARRADVIVVQKGLTVMNLRGLPRLLFALGRPVVFDFDDAVHLGPPQAPRAAPLRRLVAPRQVMEMLPRFAAVVAGNRHLAGVAAALNPRVEVIPTPMDTDLYRTRPVRRAGPLVVGWSGSSATNRYVDALAPALVRLAQRFPEVEFRVISNDDRGIRWERFPGVRTRFVPWTLARLGEDLLELDVGLMPLPDDEWSRSKCGGKVLQYMACGIPAVASPVGINAELVEEGVTGFLAPGDGAGAGEAEAWCDRISRLLADPDLRERMGREARRRVEERYSNRVTAPRLAALLARVAGGGARREGAADETPRAPAPAPRGRNPTAPSRVLRVGTGPAGRRGWNARRQGT